MAPPRRSPPFVKRVRSKGKDYFYFDTGALDRRGKAIMKRMPDINDKAAFGGSYAALIAHRTRAANVTAALTVADMVDRYQQSPEYRRLKPGSRDVYDIYLRLIYEKIGVAPADQVTRRDAMALMDTMADRPGAANMCLRIMSALWAWGKRRELVTLNPAHSIEMHAAADYEPWPETLVEEALASDNAKVRLAVAVLYFTAQRLGDAVRLRWSDIRGGVLFVRQQKTGKMLEIPVHPRLVLILGARPNEDRALIAKEDGSGYDGSSIRDWLQTFASERGYKIVPHGLRKNAVNALLEAGCSAAETAAVSGQSLQIVEHYAKRRSVGKLAARAIGKWDSTKREQENFGKPS